MDKVSISKDVILNILNYLIEQKFKDVANLVLPLEKEIVSQLQIQTEKVD